jgi:putative ABC transport system permease protein
MRELEFAVRGLRRRPVFTLVVIATLALGIGATTAIFTLVEAVILQPLPYRAPDRLAHIWENYPRGSRYEWGSERGFISVRPGTYHDWKSQSQSWERISAFFIQNPVLTGGGRSESVPAHAVDEGFFETLGVAPRLGRVFGPDDYARNDARVVVLSDALWQARFGRDPRVVGQPLSLDNATYTVIGVMPHGFYPVRWDTPKLWLPIAWTPESRASRVRWGLITFARLKPGITFDQAQQEMDVISDGQTAAYPADYADMSAVLTPVTGYLYSQYERLFALMLGAVAVVLLIACANVANLVLARSTELARDLAVRAALGATQRSLIRAALTECFVLALPGGAIGVLLAHVGLRPILALLPASSRVPRLEDVELNPNVLLFALAVTLLTTIVAGLVPACRASRVELQEALREGGRSPSLNAGTRRLGNLLIVAEMTLAFVLVMAAGLLLRSFVALNGTPAGFNPDQVLAINLTVPHYRYGTYTGGGPNELRVRLFDELERGIAALPGVRSATVTTSLPLRHGPNPWSLHIDGLPPPASGRGQRTAARSERLGFSHHGDVSIERVTPGYFQTFQIPLLRGRLFDARDRTGAPLVAVINETTATRYFQGHDPIGRQIVVDMTSYFPRLTVVGIVADSHLHSLDRDAYPNVFWPMAQLPGSNAWVAIRTHGDPAGLTRAIEQEIRRLAPEVAIAEVQTMNTVVHDSLWRPRLAAWLLGVFGAIAALLAAAGIYAVFSYAVTRRMQEIGLRIALGAAPPQVLRLIVGSALKLALAGLGLGVVATLLVGSAATPYLHGVQPHDLTTMSVAAMLMLAVALVACWWPARRATRIDPMIALRQE